MPRCHASENGIKVGIGVGWLCGPTKDPKKDSKTVLRPRPTSHRPQFHAMHWCSKGSLMSSGRKFINSCSSSCTKVSMLWCPEVHLCWASVQIFYKAKLWVGPLYTISVFFSYVSTSPKDQSQFDTNGFTLVTSDLQWRICLERFY